MKLFLLSTSAMLIANGAYAATYQCNFPTDKSQTTCPLPRIPFTCEDDELACCNVKMTPEERQRVRNRTTRDSTLRQLGTVNLNGHGTCTAAAEDIPDDSSSSPDEDEVSPDEESSDSEDEEVDTPPEEEYDAELDEEFEFAMTENRRCNRDNQCGRNQVCNTRSNRCVSNLNRCRVNSDCGSRQFCDRSLGRCINNSNRNRCNRDSQCRSGQVCDRQGRCVNDDNRNRCNRDSQCRANQRCTRSGRCVNTNNFCRNDSQCRNRNDYCNKSRNRCERATGQSCSQGVDCGNGQGSQWMCRQGRCQPRSLFEMAMMETE